MAVPSCGRGETSPSSWLLVVVVAVVLIGGPCDVLASNKPSATAAALHKHMKPAAHPVADVPAVAHSAPSAKAGAAASLSAQCLGGDKLTQFLAASKSDFCSTHALSGADGDMCHTIMPAIPCDQTASALFFGYSRTRPFEQSRLDVVYNRHPIDADQRALAITNLDRPEALIKHLRGMAQETDKKRVFIFQILFDEDEQDSAANKCGNTHVFVVVKWPEAHAGHAGGGEPQSCLLQSYVTNSGHDIGYTLRQWVYGYDVAHPEQDDARAQLPQTDKAVFEAARSAFSGPRKFTTFVSKLEELLSGGEDKSRHAFATLFGCDPGGGVTANIVTLLVRPVDEQLQGFTTLLNNAKRCRHGQGMKRKLAGE